MNVLKEILRVVLVNTDKEKVFPELVDAENARPSLTGKLLKGMEGDLYSSDEDAALDLYGTEANDQRFRTLKSRMYDRLVQSVLFLTIKQPEHSEYIVNYFKCQRALIAARILMKFASHQAGYVVATKTLSVAERYQFTDISLQLAVLLRDYSSVRCLNLQFKAYSRKVNRYLLTLSSEYESDYLLDDALLGLKISHFEHSHYIKEHEEIYKRIKAMNADTASHVLRINEYRAAIFYYETLEDYRMVCDQCENAISYLDQNSHLSQNARVGEFNLRRISAILCSRRRIELEDGAFSLSVFADGGHNWYSTLGILFASSLYNLDYDAAYEYYDLATSHTKFDSLDGVSKERWTIYNAYLLLCELLSLTAIRNHARREFRLSTFLNSTNYEAKAKGDANSLIEIVHALYLLLVGDYNGAEKRIEYLNVYCTRYLRDSHFDRLRLFIKALQHIPRHLGDSVTLKLKAEPFLHAIRAAASTPIPAELNELLPYDVMLVALLSKLEASESW
ncbi:MAG: hypothetical protein NTX15_04020 [Candidatus Kapabacteria bacterium]|nr:hypothetical protein [Candidatus Kapabacteria bacterium]